MWRSLFLVHLESCRLIGGNFTIKLTPSQVFFDSILSSPHAPPCFDLSTPPIKFRGAPRLTHVRNTCGKPCTQIWFCVTIHQKYVKLLVKISMFTHLWNSGAENVSNKLMPGWSQNFSVYLGNTLTKKLLKTQQKLCVLSQQWLWHTSTFCQGLWFVFLITVEIICSIGEHIIQC